MSNTLLEPEVRAQEDRQLDYARHRFARYEREERELRAAQRRSLPLSQRWELLTLSDLYKLLLGRLKSRQKPHRKRVSRNRK